MNQQEEIIKYDFVDALRAFAILPVIFTHTHLFYNSSISFLRVLAEQAAFGVQLFYLVSAFTLFLSLGTRSQSSGINVRDFFIRRIFRIVPLFYLALIIYAWYYFRDLPNSYHIGLPYWQHLFAPSGIKWWYVPLTALFLNGWMPETINSIIPVGWSVAVEMVFYLWVPFLFRRIKDIRSALVFIASSLILQRVLVLVLRPVVLLFYPDRMLDYLVDFFFYQWFFSQLPIFGLGILTYHIFQEKNFTPDRRLGMTFIALSGFLFFAVMQTYTLANILPQHFFYSLAFMTLSLGVAYAPIKLLVNPVTVWIGKVSFSLYLVHDLVLDGLWRVIPEGFSGLGKTVNFFLFYVIVILLSSAISYFTYRFVEAPGMRLGKAIIKRFSTSQRPLETVS